MLIVVLLWMYIAFSVFCLGFAGVKWIKRRFDYDIKHTNSIMALGVIISTVYAQLFSFVYKVGMLANIILIVACGCILVFFWKDINIFVKEKWNTNGRLKKIGLIVLVVIWTYFTSRGYIHYDTDLYHAQSIRWLEEYGVVKGLGNLHVRFAYNSSIFALTALYSISFLTGQSMHVMSGFFALLLSTEALKLENTWNNKTFSVSDMAKISAIYYLSMITDEVVSPASDYVIMCTIFFIIIKWIALLESKEDNITPYALLCVAGVYAITLKLTAGLILILTIKPAYHLIKEKRIKDIFTYIIIGLAVMLPWMIRTVIISGYLLYPFPALDLFNVDWKIDAAKASVDAAEIKTWGRALNNAMLVNKPVSYWFPIWFSVMLSKTEKLIIISDIIFTGLTSIISAVIIFKRDYIKFDKVLLYITLVSSYAFWQLSAPLLRYGYAYALLVIVIPIGYFLNNHNNKKIKKMATLFYFTVILVALVKVLPLAKYAANCASQPYYIWQKDYGTYEVESYEVEGLRIYYPKTGDQTGYYMFPSAPYKTDIEFRGDSIKDGFRMK